MRPTTRHLACPFPPCTAEWWFGDLMRNSVPVHAPQGFASAALWLPWCPGTMTVYKPDSDELTEPDKAKIERAYQQYLAQQTETVREPDEVHGEFIGGPLGRPVDPNRDRDEFFPGRPADAPEPGVGEPPAAPVQIGTGHHLGKAAMDNAHQTAAGLAGLAVNQMGLTQDLLARITDALDEAAELAVAAEAQIGAVQSLVTAAVGTGEAAGMGGNAMAEQTALAKSTIGDARDGILSAIHVAKVRVGLSHQQIMAAVEGGRQYIAGLGHA